MKYVLIQNSVVYSKSMTSPFYPLLASSNQPNLSQDLPIKGCTATFFLSTVLCFDGCVPKLNRTVNRQVHRSVLITVNRMATIFWC